jgi:peroxiredoxin
MDESRSTDTLILEKGVPMSTIALNAKAPDFELEDFNGRKVRLSEFRGKSHVLLVFNRGFM